MSYDKERRFPRIASTPDNPIGVAFKEEEMREIAHQVEVRDVSEVGLGLKVPLGKRFLTVGLKFQDFEISLPGIGICRLSGKIVYKRLGHVGIEFDNGDPAEHRKLERFTSQITKG